MYMIVSSNLTYLSNRSNICMYAFGTRTHTNLAMHLVTKGLCSHQITLQLSCHFVASSSLWSHLVTLQQSRHFAAISSLCSHLKTLLPSRHFAAILSLASHLLQTWCHGNLHHIHGSQCLPRRGIL